jgi:hypothetical protein
MSLIVMMVRLDGSVDTGLHDAREASSERPPFDWSNRTRRAHASATEYGYDRRVGGLDFDSEVVKKGFAGSCNGPSATPPATTAQELITGEHPRRRVQ